MVHKNQTTVGVDDLITSTTKTGETNIFSSSERYMSRTLGLSPDRRSNIRRHTSVWPPPNHQPPSRLPRVHWHLLSTCSVPLHQPVDEYWMPLIALHLVEPQMLVAFLDVVSAGCLVEGPDCHWAVLHIRTVQCTTLYHLFR